jgi:hypothetical protein
MVSSIVEGGVGGLVECFVFCTLQQMTVSNKRGGRCMTKGMGRCRVSAVSERDSRRSFVCGGWSWWRQREWGWMWRHDSGAQH